MSDKNGDAEMPYRPQPIASPPRDEDERRAWDAFASAALTGWLWSNVHQLIQADAAAIDAGKLADAMILERRRRRNTR